MRLVRISASWGVLTVAVLLLLGMTVNGCAELTTTVEDTTRATDVPTTGVPDGSTSTEVGVPSTEVTSSTTAAPSTTPTTQALSSAETLLPSGHIKALGFITTVWEDGSGRHLRIDYVDTLTWEEAVAAGMEDPDEPHDGFWYSNVNPMLREFDVSNSAAIFTSYRSRTVHFDTPCTWADFMSFWASSPPPDNDYMRDELWWIERDGDTIVWISQQFIP
jgi:hypothetical protein